jgi:hypothetical protein
MPKNKNYYQIHKNKSPKRRVDKINWIPIYRTIEAVNELVKSFIELRNSMLAFKIVNAPIPKYKKGTSEELAIVGDNSNHEYFVSLEGEKYRVKQPFDYEKHSKDHFDIDLKRRKASEIN